MYRSVCFFRIVSVAEMEAAWTEIADCLLGVGGGDEGVLERAVLHRALEVVVHGARLREEALDACRRGRTAPCASTRAATSRARAGSSIGGLELSQNGTPQCTMYW